MSRGPRVARYSGARFQMPKGVSLSASFWTDLTDSAGRQLGEEARRWIEAIATQYVLNRVHEKHRPMMRVILRELDGVVRTAEALIDALPAEDGAADFACGLLLMELSWDAPPGFRDFDELRTGLPRFLSNLTEVRRELVDESDDWEAVKGLEPWDILVSRLDDFARKNGIKVSARGDADTAPERSSPFVELVEQVVRALPDGLQEHTHSKGAMAKAVQRSLAKTNQTELGPLAL